jgi:hypothetical protein
VVGRDLGEERDVAVGDLLSQMSRMPISRSSMQIVPRGRLSAGRWSSMAGPFGMGFMGGPSGASRWAGVAVMLQRSITRGGRFGKSTR